jgi:hypothetical protein
VTKIWLSILKLDPLPSTPSSFHNSKFVWQLVVFLSLSSLPKLLTSFTPKTLCHNGPWGLHLTMYVQSNLQRCNFLLLSNLLSLLACTFFQVLISTNQLCQVHGTSTRLWSLEPRCYLYLWICDLGVMNYWRLETLCTIINSQKLGEWNFGAL